MQYLNAVVDLSGNNILTQSIHVIEVADTILLFVGHGSKLHDWDSPALNVRNRRCHPSGYESELENLLLKQSPVSSNMNVDMISLNGSSVVAVDDVVMTITLTEQQRTKSIAMSGTRGGDGEALILSSAGSMAKDIAQNPTVEDLDANFVELNDTEHPSIINAALTCRMVCYLKCNGNPRLYTFEKGEFILNQHCQSR